MDIDNLIKAFEDMHISDQLAGSRASDDIVLVDRPTSTFPIPSIVPDDNQIVVSTVPRAIGAGAPAMPGILWQDGTPIGLGSHNTASEITRVAHKLFTNYTVNQLIYDSKVALQDWLHLLELTTLPSRIASSDPIVATRLNLLDSIIAGNHGRFISRLAHIQFLHAMESLEAIIARDRSSGITNSQRDRKGAKNAAYRRYREASTRPLGVQQLYHLKRCCIRYQVLAGPSPIFILAYTDMVDIVVKSSTSDDLTIGLLARFVEENVPRELIHLCDSLAKIAENYIELFSK
ncbi:hypothetical protein HD806DRAFT_532284 [Xylariaceae sp. AK1471]|nr:hypothetical protein HD806DRAFT_532149 [Xylariaceae sp. AK1471]KAI3326649.1 hypothetical protein HD806DRAFT_532284 [Xylariaceae sp. AK1471]